MMALKQPLFVGRFRPGPDDRTPHGDQEPANHLRSEEVGGQRGAAYYNDPSAEIDLLDDGAGPARNRARSGIALVAALAVFAGILWYAYDWGMGQLETAGLPVIVADTTPIKSRPENPGGIEVPNQDVAVLNDPAPGPETPQAERLLPPPEAPQPPQVETSRMETAAKVEDLLEPPLETAAGPPDTGPTIAEAQPPAPPQVAVGGQPEAAPDPVLPEAAPAPIPPEATSEATPETVPPEAEAAPVSAPPEVARRRPEPPAPPAVAAAIATAPQAAPQVAALPDAKTGGFVVQLAAFRSRDSTGPAWASLQRTHPMLLGDRELAVQKVDLGDRGIFYRVQTGFFAERASARDLCNALKTRGQDCLVLKR